MATATKSTAKPMHKPAAKPAAQATTNRPPQTTPRPQASVPATRPASSGAIVASDMNQVPDYMRKYAGQGMEGTRREDLEIPRLKLMQGLSPELQVYDALKAGHFFHTVQEHVLDRAFRAVVLLKQYRYLLWNPLDSGGGILARADDGVHWAPADTEFDVTLDKKDGGHKVKWATAKTVAESGLANWGTQNPEDPDSPPAATLMYEYVLAFPDLPDLQPAVLTLQRSAIKQGKRWNTKINTLQRFPMFGLVFEISSFDDTNRNNQDFKNVNAVGAGHVGDPQLLEHYHNLYQSFKSTGVKVKDEGSIQGEGQADNSAEPDDGKPSY